MGERRNMFVISMALLLYQGTALPQGRERYVTCKVENVTGRNTGEAYASNVIITTDHDPHLVAKAEAFANHIRERYVNKHYLFEGCAVHDTRQQADVWRARWLDTSRIESGRRRIAVDWPSASSPLGTTKSIAKAGPPNKSGPGSITVEDTGGTASAKAWDNVLLQAKREEAGRQASIAAQTAESKAKHKLIIDKAIAEAKKRGNKQ